MDEHKPTRRSLAPAVVVAFLLLLPLLYIGSYLVLVVPKGRLVPVVSQMGEQTVSGFAVYRYRVGGHWLANAYLPLERIDRKLRPEIWDSGPNFEIELSAQ